MRKLRFGLALALLIALVTGGGHPTAATADSPKVLDWDMMVGVPQGLTGAQAPIRGVNGGGLPWAISSAKGKLTIDGQLDIKVKGLVLAAGANTGNNPIAEFRAIVSCLDGSGSIVNVTTDLFPATTGPASEGGGNARIMAQVSLPQPCIAPIVFVTSPGGAWFAVTGGGANGGQVESAAVLEGTLFLPDIGR